MKIKRVISIIIATLFIASLCVFVMGCTPSNGQTNKNEQENEQQKQQELSEYKVQAKEQLDAFYSDIVNGTEEQEAYDAHFLDYALNIIKQGKKNVDAAEDLPAAQSAFGWTKKIVKDRYVAYGWLIRSRGVLGLVFSFKVVGEYEDITYEIKSIQEAYYGGGIRITSNSEDVEVECIADGEYHWENAHDRETGKTVAVTEENKTDLIVKTNISIFGAYDWDKHVHNPDDT